MNGHLKKLEASPDPDATFSVRMLVAPSFAAPWRLTVAKIGDEWRTELAAWDKQRRAELQAESPVAMAMELDRTPFSVESSRSTLDEDTERALRGGLDLGSFVQDGILDGWSADVRIDQGPLTHELRMRFSGNASEPHVAFLRSLLSVARRSLSTTRSRFALSLFGDIPE